MKTTCPSEPRPGGNWVHIVTCVAAVTLLLQFTGVFAETQQEQVHRMSHHVMPFDMAKTVHVFKMTASGGEQRVLIRNPVDGDQIALIRRHLKHEMQNFRRGDYSDPVSLHGANMPGLAEMQTYSSRIEVSYADIPDGAQLTFKTTDLQALTAIHRWFGAQLSEHGADARAE